MSQPSEPQAYAEGQEFQIRDYWQVLVRRRMVVFACLALVVTVVMTLTFLTTPKYTATTTLEIQRFAPEVVEFTDVMSVDPNAYWDFHQTQQKILQSRTVARLAAEKLDLANRPEFAGRQAPPIRRLIAWGRSLAREPTALSTEDAAISFIQGGLTVGQVRNSTLYTISFVDQDPELAALVSSAVAQAYQKFQLDARYDTTGQAKEFLTKDVALVRAELAELEQKLQTYSVEKNILGLSEGTQDISEQALTGINSKLTQVRTELARAQAHLDSVRAAPPEGLTEVLNSSTILHLRQRQAELNRKAAQMSEQFKSNWPPLAQVNEELAEVRRQISDESENIARHVRATAEAKYGAARSEYEALLAQSNQQMDEVQRKNQNSIQYTSLRTEIETKRRVLANLVERQSETETSYRLKETGSSNVRVVDRAEVPKYQSSPNKKLNLLMSLLLGLAVGAVAALGVDYLDSTIKSEADVLRVGSVPIFGRVPLTGPLMLAAADDAADKTHSLDVASHTDPRSHFSESFRNLRTSLLLAAPDRPPRHVLVTSCQPSDGKSTVATNLAIVLAQLGRKVLLVDADLRRPRVNDTFGLSSRMGLSNYLGGNASLEEVVVATEYPGMSVIPSGPIPPNPSELLGSPKIDFMLDGFLEAEDFDHVILDSPPLLSVADSIILSAKVDSTMMVVRAGATRREFLSQSLERLRQSRASLVGVVLNAVSEQAGYYYRYSQYHAKAVDQSRSDTEPQKRVG